MGGVLYDDSYTLRYKFTDKKGRDYYRDIVYATKPNPNKTEFEVKNGASVPNLENFSVKFIDVFE
jgi:hypothetical protein